MTRPTRQSKRKASRRGEASNMAELLAERDRMWQMSIHGGLSTAVRNLAKKKLDSIQKEIEALTPTKP